MFANHELPNNILSIVGFCPPQADFDVDVQHWLASGNQSSLQLVLGDFNDHNPLWGYSYEDARGTVLIDSLMTNNLKI